jgi:hypothetical protein
MGEMGEIAAVWAGGKHGKRSRIMNSARQEAREAQPQLRKNGEYEGAIRCCAILANAAANAKHC